MQLGRNRGFTLVEVLVALLIMAAMAVIAWRGIDGMLRSREISQEHLIQTERLQTVLAQWEQDLRSLQDGTIVNPLSFDGASLRITRQQRNGLQVVAWTVSDGQLYRWESEPVTTLSALSEAFAQSQQSLSQAGSRVAALGGITGWQMYFYRGNAWSNAQSSDDVKTTAVTTSTDSSTGVTTGNATVSRVLPTGVRMVLQFAPGSGLSGTLTRQVALSTPTPP